MKHRFCSTYSAAQNEPLAGMGTHPERILLIAWPKAKWRHAMSVAADMDNALAAAIARATEAGWRVNLIDRKEESLPQGTIVSFPDGARHDAPVQALPEWIMAITQGRAVGTPLTRPVVLCCTHGQHDRCCAKFGFAAYRALTAANDNRFDIWESTHLGGCRLAATALFMPAGRKYGRITPTAAPKILAAEAEGYIWLPCLRGTTRLESCAQVAEAAALMAIGVDCCPPARNLTCLHVDDSNATYHVDTEAGRFAVDCIKTEVTTYGCCDDMDKAALLHRHWHASSVRAL